MPKLSYSVPKYRRHRSSGQAIVTLAGRDHYLGPYGTKSSRTEYDRVIGEWIAAGRPSHSTGGSESCSDITVVELVVRYLAFAKSYYRKNGRATATLQNIKYAVRHLKGLYGRTLAVEFGPRSLKALQSQLIDSRVKRLVRESAQDVRDEVSSQPLSRRYVNDCIDVIRRMFRWAASEELVPVTVYQALATVPGLRKGRTTARETAPITSVDDATIDATLPNLPSVVADMVRLQRLTGSRPGEVCALRPKDVDCAGGIWRYRPASHKTEHFGRQRVIFVGPKAQAILTPYMHRDSEAFCFSPAESEQNRRATVHARRRTPSRYGNTIGTHRTTKPKRRPRDRYDKDAYARAINRACRKAGIQPWSPNRLRHTAATEIRRQYGLEAAQVALGHAHADVTQVYAERDMALAERIAAEIG